MTIKTCIKKFEELKTQILADGKVDYDEAERLLEFIAPYARSGNKNFTELYKVLVASKMDGVITSEESDKIISYINNVTEFLKIERKIEQFLCGCLIGLAVFGIAFLIFG